MHAPHPAINGVEALLFSPTAVNSDSPLQGQEVWWEGSGVRWEELRAGHPQVCGEMDLHDSPTDMRTGMPTNKTGALDRILAGKCFASTQISLGGALHKHAVVRGKGGGVEEGHCTSMQW